MLVSNGKSMLLRFVLIIFNFNIIWQKIPSLLLGFIDESQNIQEISATTCNKDLKENWCTVVYNPTTLQSEYNCFNLYSYNIFSGVPQCGDFLGEIQDSGCKTIKKLDGSECKFCCCKGTLCNDPSVFLNIATNKHLYLQNNSNTKISLKNFILILIFVILYLFYIKIKY
uniref:Uncharacterized protein n=1 Tax=Strongyloides venezuelensis TaxID=75913 RepID=A0A0K0EXR5_STRVS